MNLTNGIPAAQTLLGMFETVARAAAEAEAALRKKMEAEILRLERRRAFAYRRLNFMRLLTEAVRVAENDESAVAIGRTVVRADLGWESDSETRAETLSRLEPVIQATFSFLALDTVVPSVDQVMKALDDFEAWYASRFEQPFWILLEQPVEELPLVER